MKRPRMASFYTQPTYMVPPTGVVVKMDDGDLNSNADSGNSSEDNTNSGDDDDKSRKSKKRGQDWVPAKQTKRYKESHKATEKHRREKINLSLEKLADLVPQCRTRLSKPDKLSVLSQTVEYIKAIRQTSKLRSDGAGSVSMEEGKAPSFLDQEWRRLLLNNIDDLLHVCNDQGVIVSIFPSCKAVLGYEPDELANRSLQELLHPHDAEYVMSYITQKTEQIDFVARYQKKNKEYVWLAVKGRWESLKLHKSFMVGVGRLYDSLLQPGADQGNKNYDECFAKYALNGTCTYISVNVRAVLGFTPEEMLGKEAQELFHPEEMKDVWGDTSEFIDGHKQLVVTHRLMTKGGRYRWVETKIWPFLNPISHKPEFFFGKSHTTVGTFSRRVEPLSPKAQLGPLSSPITATGHSGLPGLLAINQGPGKGGPPAVPPFGYSPHSMRNTPPRALMDKDPPRPLFPSQGLRSMSEDRASSIRLDDSDTPSSAAQLSRTAQAMMQGPGGNMGGGGGPGGPGMGGQGGPGGLAGPDSGGLGGGHGGQGGFDGNSEGGGFDMRRQSRVGQGQPFDLMMGQQGPNTLRKTASAPSVAGSDVRMGGSTPQEGHKMGRAPSMVGGDNQSPMDIMMSRPESAMGAQMGDGQNGPFMQQRDTKPPLGTMNSMGNMGGMQGVMPDQRQLFGQIFTQPVVGSNPGAGGPMGSGPLSGGPMGGGNSGPGGPNMGGNMGSNMAQHRNSLPGGSPAHAMSSANDGNFRGNFNNNYGGGQQQQDNRPRPGQNISPQGLNSQNDLLQRMHQKYGTHGGLDGHDGPGGFRGGSGGMGGNQGGGGGMGMGAMGGNLNLPRQSPRGIDSDFRNPNAHRTSSASFTPGDGRGPSGGGGGGGNFAGNQGNYGGMFGGQGQGGPNNQPGNLSRMQSSGGLGLGGPNSRHSMSMGGGQFGGPMGVSPEGMDRQDSRMGGGDSDGGGWGGRGGNMGQGGFYGDLGQRDSNQNAGPGGYQQDWQGFGGHQGHGQGGGAGGHMNPNPPTFNAAFLQRYQDGGGGRGGGSDGDHGGIGGGIGMGGSMGRQGGNQQQLTFNQALNLLNQQGGPMNMNTFNMQ